MTTLKSKGFFLDEELQYILNLPETKDAKTKVTENSSQRFFIDITPSIKETLQQKFDINLDLIEKLPMRWIKGDTPEHVDVPSSDTDKSFKNTYLVHLNDCLGEFVVGEETHLIEKNTGFVFREGVTHSATNTGDEPRLLLGPMSENGVQVGTNPPAISYYRNLYDANVNNDPFNYEYEIAQTYSEFTVGNYSLVDVSGSMTEFITWKIASVLDNDGPTPSPSDVVYRNGDVLNGTIGRTFYRLYYFPVVAPTNEPPLTKPFGLVPTVQFTLTVPNRIYMKNLFSDNSTVFYKPGTLAPGGIGTVKNSRRKAKHT